MSRDECSGEMQISEAELGVLTRELDMLHHETFPGVRATLDEFAAHLSHLRSSHLRADRRTFLLGASGVVALGAAAACSSSTKAPASSTSATTSGASTPSTSSSSPYTGDLKVVALAAALENLAVTAYKGSIDAAASGKLGTVPNVVAAFATTAMKQHADHSAAWNSVLSKANLPTISDAPLTITPAATAALGKARSVADVAKLALGLEQAAAQTYTYATATVSDAGTIIVAATIQPVEAMHAAILNFVLGQYPVPASFIGVDKAVKPDALTR